MEDQDFFRFFGIYRNVTLYAKPEIHVEDLWAKPVLNEDNASGSFALDLSIYSRSKAGTVTVTLTDRENRICLEESRVYAPPAQIREYLENNPSKPFILCEYMHDMGNSLGGMKPYMDLPEEYPLYQGGFIWDYIDQAIFVQDEISGEKVLRYGGDFDDRPSDYEFSGNGIVFADRTEKPALQEEFAFFCIPYTPLELENATHHEELPPARRTVVSILGAVRGVGGIDSWGADVEEAYRINAGENINYSFRISKAIME